jgi:hypothetical protein
MLKLHNGYCASSQEASITGLGGLLPPPTIPNLDAALWLLNQVLPPDGVGHRGGGSLYFRRGATKGTIPTRMFSTNASLARVQVGAGQSEDTWFRTGLYRDWSGEGNVHFAGEANVLARQSLIVDCDAGSGKPYQDFAVAKAAFRAAYEALSLPPPTIVCSGGGLHAYWLLAAPITDMLLFRHFAIGLAAALADKGLQFDALCTANPVCFLRLPGTLNFKIAGQPRLVYIDTRGDGPCDISLFERFRGLAPLSRTYSRPFLPRRSCADEHPPPEHVKARIAARTTSALSSLIRLIVPFKPILHRCLQINAFAKKRGDIPEPVWRLCIGILPWVEGGSLLAHRLSKGDPDYKPEDTAAYFARSDAWDGPTTCDAFRRCGNGLCRGCPHIVHSPVKLAEFE